MMVPFNLSFDESQRRTLTFSLSQRNSHRSRSSFAPPDSKIKAIAHTRRACSSLRSLPGERHLGKHS